MQIVPAHQFEQQLFDNGAWALTDSKISAAIMASINNLLPAATNVPAGSDVSPVYIDHKADTAKAIADVTYLFNNQPAGSSSLVVVRDNYDNEHDQQRMQDFINAIQNIPPMPASVVVFGRTTGPTALPAPVFGVDEWELITKIVYKGRMLSPVQSCMIMAGYLVLIHAGGNQQNINRDIIFLNEGDEDFFHWYDYYARHTNAYYLLKEHRTFFNVRSYAG